MKNKIDLIKFIKVGGVLFLVSLATILIIFEIYTNYSSFNQRADELRIDYTTNQKEMIKREVLRVVDMIKYKFRHKIDGRFSSKVDLLETISRIKFGKDGYIFINSYDGTAMIANGKLVIANKKLWEVFTSNTEKIKSIFALERKTALNTDGGYMYYSIAKPSNPDIESPKVSFVHTVPELKWIVGAGVYLDNVENKITHLRSELKNKVIEQLVYSVVVVFIVVILFLVLFNLLLKYFRGSLTEFNLFFKNASLTNATIDLEKIKFKQFEEMAINANNMLNEKIIAQQGIIDEREKLLVTFRSVGDGLITTDEYGKVQLMNEVAERLTGWKNEKAQGKPLSDIFNIINETSRNKIENPVNRVLTEKKVLGLANHTILISKDGTEYNISDSAAPIKDVHNKVHGVVLVFRDVTKEKSIQNELMKSNERYNRLSDLTYEGILIHDNGVVIDVNSALEKISGYTAKNLVGKNIIQLMVPQKYHKTVISNIKNEYTLPYEIEAIRKDGKLIQIEIQSRNIEYEGNENNIRVTAVRDITLRRQNELEIRKLSNAISQTPVSIVITNKEGIIEYVNPKFTEVTGYTLEEAINQNQRDLLWGGDKEEFHEELIETILSGKIWTGEFHNKKKNGELFWESVNISPIKDKYGTITHFVTVKEDISRKKKLMDQLLESKEKAENADKMKSIFLAQMSHEIRTPISAMLSLTSLMRDDLKDKMDDEFKLSFDLINKSGMRIIRTVDLLLNLSEIQAGTYEVISKKFNLYSDIIAKVVVEYKKQAENKGLGLDLNLEADSTEIVADSYTVDQIFKQLIDNAIKYTDEGQIKVRLYNNEKNNLIAEVSDTGIGIADEYLEDLFTPFSQEEMGYTRKYEGNGIGLTLVKKYCELNNAQIKVNSKKGIGSTFKVIF